MTRRIVAIAAVTLGLIVGVGCGTEERDEPERVQRPSHAAVPDIAPPPRPDPPTEAVEAYYDDIYMFRFNRAWERLAPELQASLGGFATWKQGYRTTLSVRVLSAAVVERTRRNATVAVEIRSRDEDVCGDLVVQEWAGAWSMALVGLNWTLTDADIEKVSGGEVTTRFAECEGLGGGGAPAAVYTPPPSSYEPPPDYGYDYDRPYPDKDCEDYGGSVQVGSDDPYGLDADGDGIGCE